MGADYLSYFRNLHQEGWSDVEKWAPHVLQPWATGENTVCNSERFAEEFWNCADISVVPSGFPPRPSPTPSPTQHATPAPTAAVTPEPSSQAEPVPEPEPEPVPATPAPPQNQGG